MRIRWMAVWAVCGLALGAGAAFAADAEMQATDRGTGKASERPASTTERYRTSEELLKVVVLSRHGVRSPTEKQIGRAHV